MREITQTTHSSASLLRALLKAADRLDGLDLPQQQRKLAERLANLLEDAALHLSMKETLKATRTINKALELASKRGALPASVIKLLPQ